MNRRILLSVSMLMMLCLGGCKGSPSPAELSPESVPLTLEEWQTMPPKQKYEIVTFERLKLGNAKLQDDQEWNRFARYVMLPAKKREFVASN